MIYLYLVSELLSIRYLYKYGFKTHYDQPQIYVQVRLTLMVLKSVFALSFAIMNFSSSFLYLFFIIVPFIVDKKVFSFCFNREKKRLMAFYLEDKDSTYKNVKEVELLALRSIENGVESNEYKF